MSTLAEVRAQIKIILAAVTDVKNVYEYKRWAKNEATFKAIFKDSNDKIQGWMITRQNTPEKWRTYGQNDRSFAFQIAGLYGLSDADQTEITFQNLIESVCTTFRSNKTLNSTVQTTYPEFGQLAGLGGPQVQTVEERMFFGILCHYCEIGIVGQTLVDR